MDDDHARPLSRRRSLGAAASLEHLTGTARGTVNWLNPDTLAVRVGAANTLHIAAANGDGGGTLLAELMRVDGSYALEAAPDQAVWVNGRPIDRAVLANGDIVEFGEKGPLSRFHLNRDGRGGRPGVGAILRDGRDYLRVSRQPMPRRLWRCAGQVTRWLARDTTVLFRLSVLVAIALLVGFAVHQQRLNVELRAKLRSSSARLEQVSAALVRARSEQLRASDLNALRDELALRLGSQRDRLTALEQRFGASARIIAASVPAIAFLQIAYGYRDRDSGNSLRHVLGPDGRPMLSPLGQPLLSMEGDGPPVELQVTGTGFAIAGTPLLATNRHVTRPCEAAEATPGGNLEPYVIRFVGYFPDRPASVEVTPVAVSDSADLALIQAAEVSVLAGRGLTLSAATPAPGAEVIVMGYPAGLRALVVRAGEQFLAELQAVDGIDFWSVAERLAKAGFVQPLASRGIVAQTNPANVVYDAEMTHGGSGGPVLDEAGEVVAVNTAILPEYGGSKFGVPVGLLRGLLASAGYAAAAAAASR